MRWRRPPCSGATGLSLPTPMSPIGGTHARAADGADAPATLGLGADQLALMRGDALIVRRLGKSVGAVFWSGVVRSSREKEAVYCCDSWNL